VIQIPIDDFASQIVGSPEAACSSLELFRHWGLNRFSVSWLTADARKVLRQLRLWGMEVNIYNVPDLPAFLQAVTLLPKSVTADFNFPECIISVADPAGITTTIATRCRTGLT